jgi:hypothetical protein
MKTILNCQKEKVCRTTVIFSIICCFIFSQGCGTDPIGGDPVVLSKNYIQCFRLTDSVVFEIIDDTVSQNSGLPLVFGGERIYYSEYKERFDSLIKHFGDTTYNGEYPQTYGLYEVVADEFISADLISDRDFDSSHAAGKSLKNIVKFHGISPYQYITGGYKNEFDWSSKSNIPAGFNTSHLFPLVSGYHPVYKLLSELTLDDFKLLGQLFYFSFTVAPPLGEHNFTLTFKTATKEFTGTKKIVFE